MYVNQWSAVEKPRPGLKPPVVGVEGVADNEVSLVADVNPVGKVVVDGVAVEQEAAVLDYKPPRVNARSNL